MREALLSTSALDQHLRLAIEPNEVLLTTEDISGAVEGDEMVWEKLRAIMIGKGIPAEKLDNNGVSVEQLDGGLKVTIL